MPTGQISTQMFASPSKSAYLRLTLLSFQRILFIHSLSTLLPRNVEACLLTLYIQLLTKPHSVTSLTSIFYSPSLQLTYVSSSPYYFLRCLLLHLLHCPHPINFLYHHHSDVIILSLLLSNFQLHIHCTNSLLRCNRLFTFWSLLPLESHFSLSSSLFPIQQQYFTAFTFLDFLGMFHVYIYICMHKYICMYVVCMCVCTYVSFLMVIPLAGILLPTGRRPCLFRSGLSIHHVKKPLLALQRKTDICLTLQSLRLCMLSHSVMSDSLRPHGLYPTRLLSMGFSRQEHWSGLPCPPPGDLPDPGIKPTSLMPPALAGRFFTTSATGNGLVYISSYSGPWALMPHLPHYTSPYICIQEHH